MTSGHEDPRVDLPPALARAQDDLAAYIRDRVSPETALLKIMEVGQHETATTADSPADPAHRADSERGLAIIRARAAALNRVRALDLTLDRVRGLARDLDRVGGLLLNLGLDLDFDRVRARALARDIGLSLAIVEGLGLVRELDRGLVHELTVELNLVRELALDRELERDRGLIRGLTLDRELIRSLDRAIDRARGLVSGLVRVRDDSIRVFREIAAAPVDVSGADLSGEDLSDHLLALQDVIWTPETTKWPPGVASLLLLRSREIRPGVYQVGGDWERDPVIMVTG